MPDNEITSNQSKYQQKEDDQLEYRAKDKSPKATDIIRDEFSYIGLATILFALFYTFCLYKNLCGITFPFLVGGCFTYLIYCMKRLKINRKRGASFYVVCSVLLGLSTFITDSTPIHVFNFMGVFLLIGSFMLHQMYEDDRWDFSKYLGSLMHLIFYSLAHVFLPFAHFDYFLKNRGSKKNGKTKYIIYGFLIAIPLLMVVLVLLASADYVFQELVLQIFELGDFVPEDVFGIVILTIFVFFGAYSFLCSAVNRDIKSEMTDRRTAEPLIAITFTSVLTLVYLLFCGIQVVYLFVGGRKLPNNFTYADYAREGYFQLLFVCLINLVMVLICLKHFREHKVLKAVLTVVSGCTYVMIASSIYRMILYVGNYCLTFTRVLVLWSLLVLTILLTGIVVRIYRPQMPLFRFCMIVVTLSYLGLSFSHQDYWIAKYNLICSAQNSSFDMDYDYLDHLSADKYPALAKYMTPEDADRYLGVSYPTLAMESSRELKEMNWRNFNLAKYYGYYATRNSVLQRTDYESVK